MRPCIAFLDLETTGLSPRCSVLSACAFLARISEDWKLEGIDVFERAYYPLEGCNRAKPINGLGFEEIAKLRKNGSYPEFFRDDTEAFKGFLQRAKLYVAHNFRFDASFLPFRLSPALCTMKIHRGIKMGFESHRSRFGPSLDRLAGYYGVEVDPKRRHTSRYDVELLVKIFERMLLNPLILPFLSDTLVAALGKVSLPPVGQPRG